MVKYFCIGTHKTGTTSLEVAFELLGYKSFPEGVGTNLASMFYQNKNQIDYNAIDKCIQSPIHHFYQDSPWCHGDIYKYIYQTKPDSKFILTDRDSESWFTSILNWNNNNPFFHINGKHYHKYEYDNNTNDILPNKDTYIKIYEERVRDIKLFFSDKKDSLLVLNLNKDNAWDKLCNFIGCPVPNHTFPYKNKQQY